MKKVLFMAVLGLVMNFSSKAQITYSSDNGAGDTLFTVSGTLVGTGTGLYKNLYFKKNHQYLLTGYVFVDSLTTLNIAAGTVIKGDKPTKGTLIIKRGAKLKALGTNTDPVIFTSNQPIGSRAAGDWGGVVICGRATNNLGTNVQLEGNYGAFHGGTDDLDNSGTIKFVRIEFAGIALNPNQEINSLTMGSVGSGTIIHHVQVSYAGDDSYEWFGGTVNSRYLIAYNGVDDCFDTDNGYRGYNQWGIGLHNDPNIADVSKTNGFESDNNSGSTAATPKTRATFSNYAMYGPLFPGAAPANANFQAGAHIRRNSEMGLYNSVLSYYPKGIIIDGSTTIANANGGLLNVENCAFVDNTTTYNEVGGSLLPTLAGFFTANADTAITAAVAKFQNPYGIPPAARNFAVKFTSPLKTGASFADARVGIPAGPSGAGFSTSLTERGAAGNWAGNPTLTWFNYDPQNVNYNLGNWANYMPEADKGTEQVDAATKSAEVTEVAVDFDQVAIYPNPADVRTMFSVEFEEGGAGVVTIIDMNGRAVATTGAVFQRGLNEFFYDSSVLENGLYKVSITNGGVVKTSTMLVSHQ
ncbi:MAG: T9SS type A sorting domain-containing protein [Flavobacteriales bacterium]